jgi:hypothetical protein
LSGMVVLEDWTVIVEQSLDKKTTNKQGWGQWWIQEGFFLGGGGGEKGGGGGGKFGGERERKFYVWGMGVRTPPKSTTGWGAMFRAIYSKEQLTTCEVGTKYKPLPEVPM